MKLLKNLFLLSLLVLFSQLNGQILEPVKWNIETKSTGVNSAEIVIKAKLDKGWHLYGMNIPADGPKATEIIINELENCEKIGTIESKSKLIESYDSNFDMELSWYENEAIFVQKVKTDNPKAIFADISVEYMSCNDVNCLPPATENLIVGKKGVISKTEKTPIKTEQKSESKPLEVESVPLVKTEKIVQNIDTLKPVVEPVDSSDKSSFWKPLDSFLTPYGEDANSGAETSLWWIFFAGMLGGFVALFTPCVWPIIPMTVSFFLKRSDKKSGGRRDAILYGIAIIVIYVGLGLLITAIFGASALNSLSTSAVFNLIFFALLVFFAISFFGAFEITLPASWSNKMDSKADSTAGLLSIMFMAFTLVLVSFSCTGPIIGTLLVQASVSGSILAPSIGMLGFAIALAIPFSLFAFFPSMLKSMPKSGGWLNTVKVVLAFLELALSLKFLSVADLAYGWRLLDRETFLALWIVIFALLGLYLLGKLQFSHDSPKKHTTVPGLFMGIISLAFAVYMIPGLWGAPLKAISAFSPPTVTQDFNLYDNEVHAQFTDYELGMAYAASVGKPALLDFTGFGCVNCRKMEVAVWTDSKVREVLKKDFVLISLYVDDKTPLKTPYTITENGKTRSIKTVGDKWSYLQRVKFGANAQPYYAILDGKDAKPLNNYFYKFSEDPKDFVKWLKISK